MIIKRSLCAAFFAVVGISSGTFSYADETELYVFESSARTGVRPKVLIIFDNSGSMKTIEENSAAGYNPDTVYPAVGNSNAYQGRMLYFTKGGIDNTSLPTPDSPSESRRFLDAINGCAESRDALQKFGRFTGYLREYSTKGKTGEWLEVPENNGANIELVDCWEDIEAKNSINAPGTTNGSGSVANGYPVNGKISSGKAVAYNFVPSTSEADALTAAKSTGFGTGSPVTLYTDNYLRWYTLVQTGKIPNAPKSRLDIAKSEITSFISSNTSVDFGLAVFNLNYPNEGDRDGGRIVAGIRQMTPSAKNSLMETVEDLPADTNTPLCETLYEAYNYFSGSSVIYGYKDSDYNFGKGNKYIANRPPLDPLVVSNGKYISPMRVCPDRAYVIYITDGDPTVDKDADAAISTLTKGAAKAGDYSVYNYKNSNNNNVSSYLSAMASYLFNNDIVKKTDATGKDQFQNVMTFTIGFSDGATAAAGLLRETAKRGGGKYYKAQTGISLQDALNEALSSILAVDSSFTSPSIASNNFDRTQTFDAAYYAMFLPSSGPRWSGNLKKLKVTSGGVLVDSTGATAIADNGNIKDAACTFWTDCSSGKDGNKVQAGGAATAIAAASSRKILFNSASGLKDLTVSNAASEAGGTSALATFMDTTESDLDATLNWLKGIDVDDDDLDKNKTETRIDIMGDPLHSKPLALNFGSAAAPDIRVMLGTNQGLVHMFKDSGTSVSEPWSFIPYELLPNISKLRDNVPSGGHSVYGMDLSPVAYVKQGSSKIEQAWVYLGMRRGGFSYYALDISNPDSPKYMWRIKAGDKGFEELGQTWAEPVVTKIPGYDKPVLIFGGGYDPSYDGTPNSTPLGRAVYIVDAESGTLVHTFSQSSGTGTTMAGLAHSIPNAVAVLDSDNDGITDRMYASDLGANVWRIDLPNKDRKTWTAFKFAALGGSTPETNRRFFAEPAVAQTVYSNLVEVNVTESGSTSTTKTYQNLPYDAVVIGSGNRPKPSSDKTTNDMFFTLQDRNVVTRSFDGSSSNPIPAPITLDNLYNVTPASPSSESELLKFGAKLGWYYDFVNQGEKSLTAGLIVDGKVYFTSYVPPATSVSDTVCSASGQGRLYVYDLHKGSRTQSFIELGERLPDTPQIVIPKPGSGEDPYIYIIGVGKGELSTDGEYTGTINVGTGLGANKIYYHTKE